MTGLLKRWRWAYILMLAVAALHVVVFAAYGALVVAAENLVLVLLTASACRFYSSAEKADENR